MITPSSIPGTDIIERRDIHGGVPIFTHSQETSGVIAYISPDSFAEGLTGPVGSFDRIIVSSDDLRFHPIELLNYLTSILKNNFNIPIDPIGLINNDLVDTVSDAAPSIRHFVSIMRLMGWDISPSSPAVLEELNQLHFIRLSIPRWSLSIVTQADIHDVVTLFRVVFQQDMPISLWVWKYGEGRGQSILARSADQTLTAYYGSTVRSILLRGVLVLGLQVCDVMVLPKERGLLTRHGVFFKVACAFQETFFGLHTQFALAYGFPNSRVMRLAKKLSLYDAADYVKEISWPIRRFSFSFHATVEDITDKPFNVSLIDDLWKAMRLGLDDFIAVVRDASYIKYRYLDHPSKPYILLKIRHRITRRILGIVFLKYESDHVKLMDLVGSLDDFPALISGTLSFLSSSGINHLKAWVTPRQQPLFHAPPRYVSETDIIIPAHAWTPGIPLSELSGRWWISFGDTDFL